MGDKRGEGDEREGDERWGIREGKGTSGRGTREERTSYGQWATVTALIHHEAFW